MDREGLIASGSLTLVGVFRKKELLPNHLDRCSLCHESSPCLECQSAPLFVASALMRDVRLCVRRFGQEKRSVRITSLCIPDAWLGDSVSLGAVLELGGLAGVSIGKQSL